MVVQKQWDFYNGHDDWAQENNPSNIFYVGAPLREIWVSHIAAESRGARYVVDPAFDGSLFPEGQEIIIKAGVSEGDLVPVNTYQGCIYVKLGSLFIRFGLAGGDTEVTIVEGDAATRSGDFTIDSTIGDGDHAITARGLVTFLMIKIDSAGVITYWYLPTLSPALEVAGNPPDKDDPRWLNCADNTNKTGTFTRTITGWSQLTEVGLFAYSNSAGSETGTLFQLDNFIIVNHDYQLNANGLTQSVTDAIQSYYLRNSMGLGGNFNFKLLSKHLANPSATVLKAQLKKGITFANSYANNVYMGEVGRLIFGGTMWAKYEGEEILRKLKYWPVNDNGILFDGLIKYNKGLEIRDKNAYWLTNYNVDNTRVVSFEKTDDKSMTMPPDSDLVEYLKLSDDTDYSASVTVVGAITNLHDYNIDLPEASNGFIPYEIPHVDFFYIAFRTNLYTKYGNTWDRLILKLNLSMPRSNLVTSCLFRMYNYRVSDWEFVFAIDENNRGSGSNDSLFSGSDYTDAKDFEIDVEANMLASIAYSWPSWASGTTYADNDRAKHNDRAWTSIQGSNLGNTPAVGSAYWQLTINDFRDEQTPAAAADEFTHDRIKFRVVLPRYSSGKIIWFWSILTEVKFHNANYPEYSTALITTAAEGILTLTAQSGFNLPEQDGFGVGDRMIIAKAAGDFISSAYAASGIAAILGPLTIDVTGIETLPVPSDYTNRSFWALISFIEENKNAATWYNYVQTTPGPVMKSPDNLTSTGIVLTRDDILGWNDQDAPWEYTLDATQERTHIRVAGANDVTEVEITPEHTFGYGNEYELINDASLLTKLETTSRANAEAKKHTKAGKELSIPLDFTTPHQNYESIKVGDTIGLQLPTATDTGICDHTSGGSGELKIVDTETVVNKANYEIVTITVMRRYT